MRRILPAISCGLCLLLGASAGWYFGHTRSSLKNQRKMLNEYRAMRDGYGFTDKQMLEIGKEFLKMRERMNR